MGEKSESNKVSSLYVVLENRPLDQWKVTELKEELKKRKLITRGLKEELVKRLDEAVRAEMDEGKRNLEDGLNSEAQPEVQTDDAEKATDFMDQTEDKNEGLEKDIMVEVLDNKINDSTDAQMGTDMVHANDVLQSLSEKLVTEDEGTVSTRVEVVQEISVETTVSVIEGMPSEDSKPSNIESKPESHSPDQEQAKPNSADLISGSQVDEVSKVQSDSISIDTVSNSEKNDLKDNVIADDVKLEIDVKPEMVQPSSANMVLDEAPAEEKDVNNVENKDFCKEKDNVMADDVKLGLDVMVEKVQPLSESVGGNEPLKEKVTAEEKYVSNAENVDICKKNDSGDVGSSEKLNLDRSSGDDSMEEDALESKQIDSKFSSDEVGDRGEKIEVPLVKEDNSVDVMVEDAIADKNFARNEDKTAKRKPHDQEAAVNNETVKRQRRWNSEGVKVPELQFSNHSASTTPKDALQTPGKRAFSRSESTISQELPKERVVPPSTKPPTTSLRIDHFLRPFTLKAVQELLGKTGTVISFWMDHIKTHCYVTYASVEEAIETRNAVCNLQWPVNGGRLLMADFVDPQEVKNRVEPPPASPAPPVTAVPPATTMQQPQPSPRLKQQLPPPPSLPPPPPPPQVSNPLPARNRPLPPPPPPPEKIDPPIVTLDDLFRKTRATPRIYYLPLSDEQVAAKLNAQGKPVKQ